MATSVNARFERVELSAPSVPHHALYGENVIYLRYEVRTVRGRLVSPIDVADSVTIVNMSTPEETIVGDRPAVTFNDYDKTFVAPNVIPGRYRILATLRIPNKFNFKW